MKKYLWIFLLLSFAAPQTHAQGVPIPAIPATKVVNGTTVYIAPVPNATVTVCTGTTVPIDGVICSPLASIFSDPALSMAITNPTNADQNGNIGGGNIGTVYVSAGSYVITISGMGITAHSYAWSTGGSGSGGSGTVSSCLQYQLGVFPNNGTTIGCGPSVPSTPGSYPCGYTLTSGATSPSCPQSGLGYRSLANTTSSDVVLFSDNLGVISHDQAATASISESLPTPTTLGNPGFAFSYANHSSHTDTITPAGGFTIQSGTSAAGSSLAVTSGSFCRIGLDPHVSTNWLADCTNPSVASGVSSWSGDSIVACNVNSTGAVTMNLCNANPNAIIAGPQSSGTSNLVQQASTTLTSTSGGFSLAFPNPLKAGDLIVLIETSDNNQTLTDTQGNTLTVLHGALGGAALSMFYSCSVIGGADTVNSTGAAFYAHLQIYEFTGNAASGCLEQSNQINQSGGTSFSVPTLGGVAQPSELILGIFNGNTGGAATTLLNDSGSTRLQENITNATVNPSITMTAIQNANTSLSGVQTMTAIADQAPTDWVGQIMAFKLNSTGTAPWNSRNIVCGDLPAHMACPVYNATRTAQVAAISDTVMFVTTSAGLFRFTGTINCTAISASATATLNLKYTDTASTVQTVSATDTCTSLVTSGIPNLVTALRAKSGTNIIWGVTIANTPTYDVDIRLEQLP